MFKILISGFYGFDNSGDEAILHSMLTELMRECPEIEVTVLSADPAKTEKEHNVKAVNRFHFAQVFSAIKNCDVLISGGGSLFQDVTSNYSMWYYSSIILVAHILRKPVFAFAQGIGPITRSFNKKLLRYIMNRVYSLSVRDKRSQTELEKIGVRRDILCTVDPAFLIAPPTGEEHLELLRAESGGGELVRPRIGFAVRYWEDTVDICTIIAQAADRISNTLGMDVFFFPLHHKKDVQLAEDIAQRMQCKAVVVKQNYTPAQLIGLYGLMDINVCVRFHGLVFSTINHVPMVAISYDPKIDSLMEAVGVQDFLHFQKMNAGNVFQAVCNIWNEREAFSRNLEKQMPMFRTQAREGIRELADGIEHIRSKRKK